MPKIDRWMMMNLANELAIELATVPIDQRAQWLSYFLEALESECGAGALEKTERLLTERWENAGW